MNRLSREKRVRIIHMLVEGNFMRAIARMEDVSRNTVNKLLIDAGKACLDYQNKNFINLTCRKVQVDEIWSFVYAKQKNVPAHKRREAGDVWTWMAIDADTKLVPCWHVGSRDYNAAKCFINDLAPRMKNRIQLVTDGYKPYLEAIDQAFNDDIDYARLVKLYPERVNPRSTKQTSTGTMTLRKQKKKKVRSHSKASESVKEVIKGYVSEDEIHTSFIERQNLTMRMNVRRLSRSTNGFSKKIENHMHAISLHYMYYNFCRTHQTLGTTPAVAAGVCKDIKSIDFIVKITDEMYARENPQKRGKYNKNRK